MKKATVIRCGRAIFVEPLPSLIRDRRLTVMLNQSSYDPKTGDMTHEFVAERLYQEVPMEAGRYAVPAGFTYVVCKELREMGYEVEYEDRRDLEIEAPDFSRLSPTIRPGQRKVIASALSSDMGVIWLPPAWGKTFLIREICKCLPNTWIIVTSHKSAPMRDLCAQLRKEFPREVAGLGVVGKSISPKRITVCHIRSLLKAPIDQCQMLFYDEVHGAAAEQRSEFLAKVKHANMFGLSASVEGRWDRAEPIIEGLFGPVIFRMDHEDAVKQGIVSKITAHIHVLKGPKIEPSTYWERTYLGIVANEARNAGIAEVLRSHYDDKSVVVIAQDNLEHVFRLHRLLPDYVPVYAAQSMSEKRFGELRSMGLIPEGYKPLYPGEHHTVADRFRAGEIDKVISTSVWDTGIDLPDLQVVCRADGKSSPIDAIQIPGRVARMKDEGGIIVDFLDDMGDTLWNRSRARLSMYKKQKFEVVVHGSKGTKHRRNTFPAFRR